MADKLAANIVARKEHREFQIEEIEEWKKAVNQMAASPAGRLVFRSMLQYSGLFEPPSMTDTMRMVENKVRAAFYLKWIRPFLTQELRKEVEL